MPLEQTIDGDDIASSVWVKSEPDMEGTYHLYLEFGPDDVTGITEAEALAWTQHAMWVAACARHDANIYKMCLATGLPVESATFMIRAVRERRLTRHQEPPAVVQMHLESGVATGGRPFIEVHRKGERLGQWTLDDVRIHVAGMLEAIATLALDTELFHVLTEQVGYPPVVATSLITGMGELRE